MPEIKQDTAILLLNTGSSAAPETAPTRKYLRQFLSDPRIIDIPAWKRQIILNAFILPFRPQKTAEAYSAIWTERGSPLIAISEDLRDALAEHMPDCRVEIAMAYGEPAIPDVVERLVHEGVTRILAAPLFPQYASATTGSILEGIYRNASKGWNVPLVSALPPFFNDAGFLDAWEAAAKPQLEAFQPDHVLLSYHGLPERQVRKSDLSGNHCLQRPDCCEHSVPANRYCYRHHCMMTTKGLVQRLGLAEGRYSLTFQSRLGRDPWLSPATDATIVELAKQGVKRLAVVSPAFVADCLETLEELGMQGKESFEEHGGEDFLLVPSLNSHPAWVDALHRLLAQALGQPAAKEQATTPSNV